MSSFRLTGGARWRTDTLSRRRGVGASGVHRRTGAATALTAVPEAAAVRCPGCGFDDPYGLTCCGECGTPVTALCPTCGFADLPRFQFSGDGGAREAPSLRTAPPRCPLSPSSLAAPRPVMRSGEPLPPQLAIMLVTPGRAPTVAKKEGEVHLFRHRSRRWRGKAYARRRTREASPTAGWGRIPRCGFHGLPRTAALP
jgi:hypothetical protein